jgi:hypothetical protein
MLDTVSVFEVMEAEDQEHRTSSRKALALAKVRVDNSLGRFLRAAQSEEEFEERLALVSEDFTHIVANSSTEVGHEHPEHIASALKDHYHLLSKIAKDDEDDPTNVTCDRCKKSYDETQGDGYAGLCPSCADATEPGEKESRMAKPKEDDEVDFEETPAEEDQEDDGKPPWLKGSRWQPYDVERGDSRSASPKVPKLAAPWEQGYEDVYDRDQRDRLDEAAQQSEIAAENAWKNQGFHGADEVPAGHPDNLDYQGDPYGGQPCPHSPNWTTCPTCNPSQEVPGQAGAKDRAHEKYRDQIFPSMDFRSGAANNPSDQDSDSSHLVSCPQCGGDGKTANHSDCGKCHGRGKVPNFGDSMVDALCRPPVSLC